MWRLERLQIICYSKCANSWSLQWLNSNTISKNQSNPKSACTITRLIRTNKASISIEKKEGAVGIITKETIITYDRIIERKDENSIYKRDEKINVCANGRGEIEERKREKSIEVQGREITVDV